MESAEASGKTVEDALNRALKQLGANRDEIGRRAGIETGTVGRAPVVRAGTATAATSRARPRMIRVHRWRGYGFPWGRPPCVEPEQPDSRSMNTT